MSCRWCHRGQDAITAPRRGSCDRESGCGRLEKLKSCKSTQFVFLAASHSADTVNLTASLHFRTHISSFPSSRLHVSLSDRCLINSLIFLRLRVINDLSLIYLAAHTVRVERYLAKLLLGTVHVSRQPCAKHKVNRPLNVSQAALTSQSPPENEAEIEF